MMTPGSDVTTSSTEGMVAKKKFKKSTRESQAEAVATVFTFGSCYRGRMFSGSYGPHYRRQGPREEPFRNSSER
jgi:hypothetical protein